MSRIFKDSKTFVDMKLKFSPVEVENSFRELIVANPNPSKSQIKVTRSLLGFCFIQSEIVLVQLNRK